MKIESFKGARSADCLLSEVPRTSGFFRNTLADRPIISIFQS